MTDRHTKGQVEQLKISYKVDQFKCRGRVRENGIDGKLSPNRVFLARVTEGLGPGKGGAFL